MNIINTYYYSNKQRKSVNTICKNILGKHIQTREYIKMIKEEQKKGEIRKMLKQKNRKNKTNNGITLIALIVTIIVLLILAGISIATLAGENGIIAKAEEAKEKTKIAEYKEELEMIRPGLEVEKNMENLTTKEVMDRYEEQIRANPKFQAEGTEIIRKSDSKIRVITPEGYVFDVTMEGVEYKGKHGESGLPDLEEGDIKFKVEPSEWTNKDVEVEIATEYEYVLEYSIDNGSSWIEYKEKQVYSKNIEIIVRGKTELDEIKGYGTLNISNIDKLNPNAFVVTVENTTTNAITVKGETTDQGKTEQYGSSGIKEYYFSKDDGKTWESNGNKLETTYTFSKLTQGQSYSIKMKAIDNAGNETITSTVKQVTGSVPGGASIVFGYNPSTWTKGNVTVSISSKQSGYTLEYSTDGKTWTKYTTGVVKTVNGAIYARLKDSAGQVGAVATGNVSNIDKLSPNAFAVTIGSVTTNAITVKGATTDQGKTEQYGSSGIKEYYFSKDDGKTWESNGNKLETTYTFSKLTQGQSYSIKMKAIDNAGNETITSTVKQVTGSVPGGASIVFGYNPSTWTKGNVTVSISSKQSGYTLEYSTDGKTWTKYTTGVVKTVNGAIYARLKDSAGQVGAVATGNVSNIDKLSPNAFAVTIGSVTTNAITVKGATTDQGKTEQYGSSGIKEYYFSKDDGKTWESNGNKLETTYTFSKLTQGQSYSIKMKAIDNAGNETITSTVKQVTGSVPGGASIVFGYNPSTWTKGNVTVSISSKQSGYTLEYSTDAKTWTKYTTGVVKTANGAIYARLKDSTGQVGAVATGNVTKIDKTSPTANISIGTITTSSIQVKVTASDSGSGLANSGTYKYYLNGSLKSTSTANSYTFTGLSAGTSYTIKVIVTDAVGNVTEKSTTARSEYPAITSKLKAGDYVYYTDKSGTRRTCRVLYDSNSAYGIQIITAGTVTNVSLGNGVGNKQEFWNWQAGNTLPTYLNNAKNAYNNAIVTLNNAANNYLNTTYATSARCVGSVPNNKTAEATTYYDKYSMTMFFNYFKAKDEDSNHTADVNQMTSLGIINIGTNYWLASRDTGAYADSRDFFNIKAIYSNGSMIGSNYSGDLIVMRTTVSTLSNSYNWSYGLRPVFTLKNTVKITGGNGTSASPYTLGI